MLAEYDGHGYKHKLKVCVQYPNICTYMLVVVTNLRLRMDGMKPMSMQWLLIEIAFLDSTVVYS